MDTQDTAYLHLSLVDILHLEHKKLETLKIKRLSGISNQLHGPKGSLHPYKWSKLFQKWLRTGYQLDNTHRTGAKSLL